MIGKETQRTLWLFFIIHAVLCFFINAVFMLVNLSMLVGGLWFIVPLFFGLLLLALHYYFNKLIISGFFLKLRDKILDKLENETTK
jgi:hypothetical protein